MENPIVWALIATLGTWAVTAAGAATVFLFRRPSPEAMNRMLGFSAGVMIAASFWSLLQPAIARGRAGRPAAMARRHTGLFAGSRLPLGI